MHIPLSVICTIPSFLAHILFDVNCDDGVQMRRLNDYAYNVLLLTTCEFVIHTCSIRFTLYTHY